MKHRTDAPKRKRVAGMPAARDAHYAAAMAASTRTAHSLRSLQARASVRDAC